MNFIRSLSGAIATTVWVNDATRAHAQLVGVMNGVRHMVETLVHHGYSAAQAASLIGQTLRAQAMMIATNRLFFFRGLTLVIAARAIWRSPKPAGEVDISAVH